jgi:hypothetical protein
MPVSMKTLTYLVFSTAGVFAQQSSITASSPSVGVHDYGTPISVSCAPIQTALSVLQSLGTQVTSFCESYLNMNGVATSYTTTTPTVLV